MFKKALLFLLGISAAAVSFAAESAPVEDLFQRYWSSFVRKDFVKIATDILPSDLEDTKAALLPVFLAAQTHQDKEVQAIVAAFFGRTVGKGRENLSPQEVYIALHRVTLASAPDFFEALKGAKTSVVFVRNPTPDTAEIHYQITLGSESDMEVDSFVKKDGRWWLRVKEDPRETAAQFKARFTQQG